MTKIIKIHGCSGSGKTTLVRNIMSLDEAPRKIGDNPSRPKGYAVLVPGLTSPIHVVGSYENDCGGMDTIPDVKDGIALISEFAVWGNVIHEGLLQSTYYGVMGEHSKQYGADYIYAFLTTPIDLCLARVAERRARVGNTRPWNPENTRDKHRTIERLANRVQAMGHTMLFIPWDISPADQVRMVLENLE